MEAIYRTALILVIIGAVNWALVGLFRFDAVAALFSGENTRLPARCTRPSVFQGS